MYSSNIEGGKLHDKTHWIRENVSERMYKFYANIKSYKDGTLRVANRRVNLAVGGDKAYKGLLLPRGWRLCITKSGERHDIDEEQMKHDGIDYRKLSTKGKEKDTEKEKEVSNADGQEKKRKKPSARTESISSFPPADLEESQSFDPTIAKYRAVVERVMKAIKRWQVCVTMYHLKGGRRVNRIARCVVMLTNYQLLYDREGRLTW